MQLVKSFFPRVKVSLSCRFILHSQKRVAVCLFTLYFIAKMIKTKKFLVDENEKIFFHSENYQEKMLFEVSVLSHLPEVYLHKKKELCKQVFFCELSSFSK